MSVKKYIFLALAVIVIFILQQTIVLKLDARLNFWPAIIVFILLVFELRLSLIWTLSLGFLLDLYSYLPFGTHLVILFLVLIAVYFLSKNFLTNRSFMSMVILTLIACLIYTLLLFLTETLYLKFLLINKIALFSLGNILIFTLGNCILAGVLFIIVAKFTKILEPNLIRPR